MAIINSVAVGRSKKSVGEFTYRYFRGRTIASRRVTENSSSTSAQVRQRGLFGGMAQIASLFSEFIDWSFAKTTYGSSRNNFVKTNLPNWTEYREEDFLATVPVGASVLEMALSAIQETGVNLVMGLGSNLLTCTAEQDSEGAISYKLTSSQPIEEGDKIILMAACNYAYAGTSYLYDFVKVFELDVTSDIISSLDDLYSFTVDSSMLADLANGFGLSSSVTIDLTAFAATLLKYEDGHVSVRSTTYLSYEAIGTSYSISEDSVSLADGVLTFTISQRDSAITDLSGGTVAIYADGTLTTYSIDSFTDNGDNTATITVSVGDTYDTATVSSASKMAIESSSGITYYTDSNIYLTVSESTDEDDSDNV